MSKGRTYGKLSVDIWQDMMDEGLSRDARQLFPMLVAQKKASLCGALDMRLRPWARYSCMTVAEIEAALEELAGIGWVAVDWDTEEVVLCGFVKHDLQIKNPKHRIGMWRALDRVESDRLRDVIMSNLPPEIYALDDAGGTVDGEPEPDPEPPIEDPTAWSIEDPTAWSIDCPSDSPGTLNPEPGAMNQSSSSPRAGSREPVDKPVDDWVTNQAREHIEAHIEFRADAIEHPKAVARSQIPRAVELIRDVLAEDGDVYDIDDALETEWPTFDELYEPTKPASVRRLHDRLKVIA